jgi:hypothetical protein
MITARRILFDTIDLQNNHIKYCILKLEDGKLFVSVPEEDKDGHGFVPIENTVLREIVRGDFSERIQFTDEKLHKEVAELIAAYSI